MRGVGRLGARYLRLVEIEPRKETVLRGLARSQSEHEQALGQLFIYRAIRWVGQTRSRKIGCSLARAKGRNARNRDVG